MTAAPIPPVDRAVHRVCSRIITWAGALVPSAQREDWRREWEAEVWHRLHLLDRLERFTLGAQLDLLLRCLGSFRHAAWLRRRAATHHRVVRAVRAAARELRATPATSSAMIGALALALGTGGMVFGMGWQALHLPGSRDPANRVVRIWNRSTAAEIDRTALSGVEFRRFQARNRTLESIAAFRRGSLIVEGDSGRELVTGAWVTADFFHVFGQRLTLVSDDAVPGWSGETGVVLGHDLWQRRFRSDPRVVGRRIIVNGATVRVVGVAPPDFRFPMDRSQVWLPLAVSPELARPGERVLGAVGLLRTGVSRAEAHADLARLSLQLQREVPATYFGRFGAAWDVVVDPLGSPGPDLAPVLILLLGAAALTALAAAAGSAVLAADRVRVQDGVAGGLYLVFCTAASVGAGLVWCTIGLRFVSPLTAQWLPGVVASGAGLPTIGFLLLGAGLALAAMRAATRLRPRSQHAPPGRALVIALVGGIGVVLVAAGSGFERSYRRLREDGPGFRDGNLLVLPPAGTTSQMEHWRDRASALPGVEAATLATGIPYVEGTNTSTFERASSTDSLRPPPTSCAVQLVDSRYFDVLGIPLVEGRAPARDNEAVVSRSMARRFWPGAQIVGQRIQVYLSTSSPPVPVTVVGVAGDVRRLRLAGPGMAELYLPRALEPDRVPSLALRSTLTPDQIAAALGGADLLPRTLVMSEWVAREAAPYRIAAVVLVTLALAAGFSVAVCCGARREVSAG